MFQFDHVIPFALLGKRVEGLFIEYVLKVMEMVRDDVTERLCLGVLACAPVSLVETVLTAQIK